MLTWAFFGCLSTAWARSTGNFDLDYDRNRGEYIRWKEISEGSKTLWIKRDENHILKFTPHSPTLRHRKWWPVKIVDDSDEEEPYREGDDWFVVIQEKYHTFN